MLEQITWTNYWTATAILIVSYYIVLVLMLYKSELRSFFTITQKPYRKTNYSLPETNNQNMDMVTPKEGDGFYFENTKEDDFEEVEQLITQLKTVMADASTRRLITPEFHQYLSTTLKKFPTIKHSPLRSSINEWMMTECGKYSAVTLSEAEVDLLWNG